MAENKFLHNNDAVHSVTHTKYVDADNGDDSNPGSDYLPYKTLAFVNQGLVDGTHIVLKKGLYNGDDLITGKSGLYIEGQGLAYINKLVSLTSCVSCWFKNIIFFDDATTHILDACGDIHFVDCSFNSSTTLWEIKNHAGNIHFTNCHMNGVLVSDGSNVHSNAYSIELRDCKGFEVAIKSKNNSDALWEIHRSVVKFATNEESNATQAMRIELDTLSHDGSGADIPTTGLVDITTFIPERFRYLGHTATSKNAGFVIDTRYMSRVYYLDSSAGSFYVDVPVNAPIGCEFVLEDFHINTWSDVNYPIVRIAQSDGSYQFYQLNVPGGAVSFTSDGVSWKINIL